MTDNLLPCPFCGGEAELKHRPISGSDDKGWFVRCRCSARIGLKVNGIGMTKAEAIAAWNTRMERTCRMKYNAEYSGNEIYPTEAYTCSSCRLTTYDGKPDYCPYCGAKVVK